jgi:hypothetical protein
MLWIRPIDIAFRPEGGYLYFSQLFDSHSNTWFNGIANSSLLVMPADLHMQFLVTDYYRQF